MIKPQDLRIGNLISDFSGRPIKVTSINEKGISARAEHSTIKISYDLVQPIPLTEEVLVKCGFEYIEIGGEVYEQKWVINGSELLWGPTDQNGFFHDFLSGRQVYHLHQLQNLYHALTGEELIYNP